MNEKETLTNLIKTLKDNENFKGLLELLEIPEEEFKAMAPLILEEFEKGLKDREAREALIEAFKDSNMTSEVILTMLPNIKDNTAIVFEDYPDYAKDFITELINIILVAILEGCNSDVIPLSIEFCNPEAKMPTYANKGDAGMDVYALEDYTIKPGETKLIPTGIKVAIPEGYELQVRPKSGRALKTKLRVANTPGTIDSGYRSEIGVIIENIEPPIQDIGFHYNDNNQLIIDSILRGKDYYIGKGEKFAQLVLCKVYEASFTQVTDITTVKGNRGGGFGSSSIYSKEDARYGSDLS